MFGCGCILAILAGSFPRLAVLVLWLFTDRVGIAFHHGWLAPLVGLLFLPLTTFMYVLAYAPVVGVHGWGWVFVLIGLLFDLGSYAGGARARSSR